MVIQIRGVDNELFNVFYFSGSLFLLMKHFLLSITSVCLFLLGAAIPMDVQAKVTETQTCKITGPGVISGPKTGCAGKTVTFSNVQMPQGNTNRFEYVWLVNTRPSTSGAYMLCVNYKSVNLRFRSTGTYYVRRCARPRRCGYRNWPPAGESEWQKITIKRCNSCDGVDITKIKINDLNGNKDVVLQDGGTYNLKDLPSLFNLEAKVTGNHIQKVKFEISGDYNCQNTEYYYPYNAPGGSNPWRIGAGHYCVKVKVLVGGYICKVKEICFEVEDKDPCEGVDITGWKFTAVGGGQVTNLVDGGTYQISDLADPFTLEACVTGDDIQKVKLTIKDPVTGAVIASQRERFAPYNYPGTGNPWNLPVGTYKIQTDVWVDGELCVCKYITITIEEGLGSIGDFVFNDKNLSSSQDDFEDGVPNVFVELLDCDGNILETTTTDLDGKYLFDSLAAGQYQVRFSNLPEGFEFSKKDFVADDAIDTDVDPATGVTDCITLAAGEHNETIDAGICLLVPKRGAFGDRVWFDANCNGIQDPGEPGIAGVTVNAWICDLRKSPPVPLSIETSVVTDEDGFFILPYLRNNKMYQIEFTDIPAGYVFTTQMAGMDTTKDSDVNPATGFTGNCMSSGFQQANLTVDAGLKLSATIGDFVFNDKNLSSTRDADEDGVSGVTVELLDCSGNVLETTMTDFQGFYSFTGLDAGDYKVRFSNIPEGFEFSKKDQGTDDTIDTDVDQTTGETDCITLAAGETNNTIDAGICLLVPKRGAFGDLVWHDVNGNGLQDAGEPGIQGVKVIVWICDQRKTPPVPFAKEDSAVTDANGNFIVPYLRENKTYQLEFKDLPAGFSFTQQMVGTDPTMDSDVDPATGFTGNCVSTGFQTAILTADAGLVSTGNVRLGANNLDFSATVYPNPFAETLVLEMDSDNNDKPVTVRIYDINGREVYRNGSVFGSSKLNLSSTAWTNGIYILELRQGNAVEQVKLIKQ